MEPVIGNCINCEKVICVCDECLPRNKNLCYICYTDLMNSHISTQPAKVEKKRPYEPEPIPLGRVKD